MKNYEDNAILTKSKAFAIRIIKLARYLRNDKREFDLASQILRSGTSIGANVKEAVHAHTKPDFYAKLSIAYKEANETEYWLELLYESEIIDEKLFTSFHSDCKEIIKILASITKKQKEKN